MLKLVDKCKTFIKNKILRETFRILFSQKYFFHHQKHSVKITLLPWPQTHISTESNQIPRRNFQSHHISHTNEGSERDIVMKYVSVCCYHLFGIFRCVCSQFIPRSRKIFSSFLPEKEEEILMANIGMTIIYYGKIIFLFYRKPNKAVAEQKST